MRPMYLAFAMAIAVSGSADSIVSAADAVADPLESATAWVRVGDRREGTAWVVDTERRTMITAAHVIGDAKSAVVFFRRSDGDGPITIRRYYIQNQAEIGIPATVVRVDRNRDLALLQLAAAPKHWSAVSTRSSPTPVGTACRTIGHRRDSEYLWNASHGVVRGSGIMAEGYFAAGTRIARSVRIHYADLPVESGDSGSAVVDDLGNLVGMVSAFSEREPGLTVVMAAEEIRAFLGQKMPEELKNPRKVPAVTPAERIRRSTVWIRPQSTDGRGAGVVIDRDRRMVLTTAGSAGSSDRVDIVFPEVIDGEVRSEVSAYGDRVGLRISGTMVRGVVLARDRLRDLALIELQTIPSGTTGVSVHDSVPKSGESIDAVSHPGSAELMWLFSRGIVKAAGKVEVKPMGDEPAVRISMFLGQLPHRGGLGGGPVVDSHGRLVGLLAARDSTRSDAAYVLDCREIAEFLKQSRSIMAPATAQEWAEKARYLYRRGWTAGAKTAAAEAERGGAAVGEWRDAEAVRQWQTAQTEQDAEAAIRAVSLAIERDPYDPHMYRFRADLHGKTNDRNRERHDVSQVLDLRGSVDDYLWSAERRLERDEPEGAWPILRDAVRLGAAIPDVGRMLRRHGERLRTDTAADRVDAERWYRDGLARLADVLPAKASAELGKVQKATAGMPDPKERIEAYRRLMAEWAK